MNLKRKLRIGYIGWLLQHDGPHTETVAWCDVDEAKLAKLAPQHPHIRTYTDWRVMLKDCEIDLLVVSPPNYLHAPIAIEALDAGMHVFLEKPMGITREECNAILAAQKRGGGQLCIDFEIRVSPCAERLQKAIKSGRYGALRRIEYIHHQGQWLQNKTNDHWRVRRDKAGSKMLECTVHYVDLMRFVTGAEVLSVQATSGPNVLPQYEFEDNTFAHLFFENGVLGTIHNTHTHSASPRKVELWQNRADYMNAMGHHMKMIFTLSGGSIEVDFIKNQITYNRFEEYPPGSASFRALQDRVERFDTAADIFYHDSNKMRWAFINQILTDGKPVIDPLDAWKTHIVCMAIDKSLAEDFRRVEVDYSLEK